MGLNVINVNSALTVIFPKGNTPKPLALLRGVETVHPENIRKRKVL